MINSTRTSSPSKSKQNSSTRPGIETIQESTDVPSNKVSVIGQESEEESESDDDDDEMEEALAAREQQKQENISSLGKKLSVLVGQLEDIRSKYKRSKEHNDKLDAINKELITQIDTLEDENNELHENLKEKLEDAKKHKLIGGSTAEKKRKGEGGRNRNVQQKKDQGFNLALISEGDVHDNHVDIGTGANTKSVIEKYSRRLFDYVPFKKDIQEVRSTFGGATASYFSFFRWM